MADRGQKVSINQYPFGLLGLLDSKDYGNTPRGLFADGVQPTIDLRPFYSASIQLTSTTDSQAAKQAVGDAATVTVPSGEAWELIAAMAVVNTGTAAAVASWQLALQPPSPAGSVALAVHDPIAITNAAQSLNLPWTAPPGLIVGPGTQFLNQLLLAMATTVTLVCRVVYRPLKV